MQKEYFSDETLRGKCEHNEDDGPRGSSSRCGEKDGLLLKVLCGCTWKIKKVFKQAHERSLNDFQIVPGRCERNLSLNGESNPIRTH